MSFGSESSTPGLNNGVARGHRSITDVPLGSELTSRFRITASTAARLGIGNVARVALYRLCKRTGIYQWLLPEDRTTSLALLTLPLPPPPHKTRKDSASSTHNEKLLMAADELLLGRATYFSAHQRQAGSPPDWFLNPFSGKRHQRASIHWSRIADFDSSVGDIKIIWEMSRFAWAPIFAQAFQSTGKECYLSALKIWTEDWWHNNSPNCGPNWLCAQEVSIRLLNLLQAYRFAGLEQQSAKALIPFIEAHCRRIELTLSYAVAQENNHATSEATALFVAGHWLAKYSAEGITAARGKRWAKQGRKLLERAVLRLVSADGSFSQHSLTYHRMMLDTVSLAEDWRRYFGESAFSGLFYERAAAATRWLEAMIEPSSGDVPNLGANDGTNPFCFDGSDYRDFRSSLKSASRLFLAAADAQRESVRAIHEGSRSHTKVPVCQTELTSTIFPDGGYVILRNTSNARVLIRAPKRRFRPSHADALHLELWWKGENVIRDGGTYAYACGGALAEELASVVGHSTVQFDDRDQMPRLGRFLYGNWICVDGDSGIERSAEGQSWSGKYTDCWGATHTRTVTLGLQKIRVIDEVQGFKSKAVLRWRLAPKEWIRTDDGCYSPMARIRIDSSDPIRSLELRSALESRHYLECTSLPVLEVLVVNPTAKITTTFDLL